MVGVIGWRCWAAEAVVLLWYFVGAMRKWFVGQGSRGREAEDFSALLFVLVGVGMTLCEALLYNRKRL